MGPSDWLVDGAVKSGDVALGQSDGMCSGGRRPEARRGHSAPPLGRLAPLDLYARAVLAACIDGLAFRLVDSTGPSENFLLVSPTP